MTQSCAVKCVIKNKLVFLAGKGQSQTSILPEVVRKRDVVLGKEKKQLERKKMKNTKVIKCTEKQTK